MARLLLLLLLISGPGQAQMRALIIDGQNNHKVWPQTTPLLQRYLEQTGLFTVDVATTPPEGADMSAFQPDFSAYRLVVSNYNGDTAGRRRPFALRARRRRHVSVHAGGAFPVEASSQDRRRPARASAPASGPYLRLRRALDP